MNINKEELMEKLNNLGLNLGKFKDELESTNDTYENQIHGFINDLGQNNIHIKNQSWAIIENLRQLNQVINQQHKDLEDIIQLLSNDKSKNKTKRVKRKN